MRNAQGEVAKYKVRLVARGDLQDPSTYGDTYAGAAQRKSVMLLLNLANYYDWQIFTADITAAFLYGTLDKPIYMKLPDGRYVKLKKALYGLKQAANKFAQHFKASLRSLGFKQIYSDGSTYVLKRGDKIMYIVNHVDDMLMTGNCPQMTSDAYTKLSKIYTMTFDLEATELLGFRIRRDRSNKKLHLFQCANVDKVIRNFPQPIGKKLCATPYIIQTDQVREKLEEHQLSRQNHSLFQQITGSLLYLGINSRPDILSAAHALTKRMQNPSNYNLMAANRVVKYLQSTRDYELTFDGNEDKPRIYGWADASFNSGGDNRKCQYGYCFQFGTLSGMFISVCKNMTLIPQSSMESEYYGLAEACRELLWIRNFLDEIHRSQVEVNTIYQDNTSTIKMANDREVTERSKHIEVKYHYVKFMHAKGFFAPMYMPTDKMTPDIFTKFLPSKVYTRHAFKLMGISKHISWNDEVTFHDQIIYTCKFSTICDRTYGEFLWRDSSRIFFFFLWLTLHYIALRYAHIMQCI